MLHSGIGGSGNLFYLGRVYWNLFRLDVSVLDQEEQVERDTSELIWNSLIYIAILLSEKLLYRLCRGMHYGDSIKDII